MKTISSLRSKLLALTLALMASVSTFAYDFQSGYLFYNILPDGTVAVTSETYGMPYDYLPTSLVIPSEVTGYNGETYIVTEIANYAFSGCSMLDTLVIPNTVKKIGMYAFTGCTKLVYISFPESIEDILGGALYECAWYNNQPDGLIYIGNLLYRYKGTAPTGTIVVKDGTKAILDFTFSNQPNIQSVVLPESVTSIHIQAFGDCPNLESVVLPSKLEAIEDHTFQYCEKLTNIKLPDALKLIGKNAFIGCANLTKLTLPSSVQIIEDEAFANCTSLTEVTCYATIPPVRGDVVSDSPSDWFFDGVEVSKIPLYVPAESIDLYKEAEQWMFFNPILPIEPSTSYKSQWCDTWNVMWFDGLFFDETASTSQYRLGKDTVIGNYTYSKFTSRTSVRFTNDRKVYVYYEGFDDNDPYSEDLPTGEYLAYDFSAQVGDTLEVFSGVTYNTKTYKCVVYDVQTDPETNLRTIMLHPLRVVDGNGNVEVSSEEITWIEGVGSPRGFLIGTTLPGGGLYALLCAYKGDELKYTGSLYDEYGCEYNANDPQLPLVEWCNQWNILAHGYLGPQEPLYGAKTTIYQLGEDTIINHLRYKQLTRYASDNPNQIETYVGAIRFTKNNRQVYFYYDNAEYLLYDFKAQVGDTLEVFAGIDNYKYHKTYKHVVTNKEPIEDEQTKVTLEVIVTEEFEGNIYEEKFTTTWMEGVGSPDGIVHNHATQFAGSIITDLLCAYVDDRRMYRTNTKDPFGIDYTQLGCEYNEGDFIEDAFPMLSGLQRTICNEYCEDSKTSLQKFEDILFEHDQPYIYCESAFLIREENNKILIYSHSLDKDLVLYDFTLEVGDSLPRLYLDESAEKDLYWIDYNIMNVVDYHKDLEGNILPADTLIVTDVSAITLLDGKEYKKWTFNNGMEYVEGIGSYGNNMQFFDFFQLIGNMAVPVSLHGTHLVCASKNGKLLYQMDDAEMERLGAECLCDVEKKWSDTWCDTWNIMEHNVQLIGDYNEETWRHYLAEDTTINGTTYTTVNRYWTADKTKRGFVATIRFTEDQKVYALLGDTEYLVYDFSVQVGDTIETIVGVNYGTMLQQLLVHQVDIDDATNRKTITLYPLCQLEEDVDCDRCDENGYYLDLFPIQWIEGVGSTGGFLMGDRPCSDWVGGIGHKLLCAYKDDELQYINDLYQDDYGCEYNAVGQNPEDLFPTLWGLQQTICSGYYGEEGDEWASGLTGPSQEITMMDGKPYLQWGSWYLREENDKILVYSEIQKKDLVLYDFTLELGDTLTTLNMVTPEFLEYEGIVGIVDYPLSDYEYTYPIDTLVVTELSKETLLDGKEYTRWKFSDGTVYVEGIGSMSETFFHHIADHLPVPVSYLGSYLVCVSKNNKLLYQMDDAEMERLGAECLCDYDSGHRKDNAKDGQIGGRPTPTQWNQLEVVLREMDNNHTILQAETFSYTLEDISQQVNNKTYFQLARQSTKDTATTKSVVGALHFGKDEDNRVYFLRDGVEYVLYDFTAEPGDTVEIFAGINNYPQETTYTHVVTGKDTIENGACRMLLEVVFPDDTNATAENAEKVWLAGLGSVDGIVHNAAKRASNAHAAPSRTAHSSDTQTSVMLCAWREDSCLYTTDHPDYDSFGCVYNQDPTSVENTHSPSPTTDYKKLLHNGQLLIIHNGKTYNVLGIAVE